MASNTFGTLYSQVSFLNTFLPGLGVALGYIHPLTSKNTHLGARLLCTFGLVMFMIKYFYKHCKRVLEDHFMYTCKISNRDDVHDIIINWLQSQPFAAKTRSSIVTSQASQQGGRRKILKFMPWNTHKLFWYKGHLLRIRSMEDNSWREQKLLLSCIGTSPKILQQFMDDCKTTYERTVKGKTGIYVNRDGWSLAKRRDQRRMDTVVLPKELKTEFLNDLEEYLDPDAIAWYAERGIAYRRTYLFHGPPGTGKSSLSFAAAGHFDLDIYVLNLANISDATLQGLLAKLPARCIVLLEDIDVIESTNSRADIADKNPTANNLTLSGLLNALDGVASNEGRVLIMTTNYVERLDEAVIRAGRVDKKIEFGLANREMLLELFRFIYMPSSNKDPARQSEQEVVKENLVACDIQKQAEALADRVPETRFSPADILAFLIEHKKSPQDAVKNVESWVEGRSRYVALRSQTFTSEGSAATSSLSEGLTTCDMYFDDDGGLIFHRL